MIHSVFVLTLTLLSLVSSVGTTGNSTSEGNPGGTVVAANDPAPATAAKPADDSGAESFSATYQDWQLQCAGHSGARSCQVIQTLVIQGQKAPFAQLGFGKLAKDGPLYFTAVVPVNITFPSSVRVAVSKDDQSVLSVPFTRCLPTGCFASIKVDDGVVNRWKAQSGAGVLIITGGDGKDLSVPISFRGLERALDEFNKAE